MKRNLMNRRGTAEIVGTALFLVILFFFYSNVFLWHNSVSREMELVMGDKLNSAVSLEKSVVGGTIGKALKEYIIYGDDTSGTINSTHTVDGNVRQIFEEETGQNRSKYHRLQVTYAFNTGIDSPDKLRLITALRVDVYAEFYDTSEEACRILIWDFVDSVWINTGHTMTTGFSWLNLTFSQSNRYIGSNGDVKIFFKSEIESPSGSNETDPSAGDLSIDYMGVSAEPLALRVSALGGRDVQLVRLTITEVVDDNHLHLDFKDELGGEIWIPAGSSAIVVFGDETRVDGNTLTIDYDPPSGEVRFKVTTDLGNAATTSYDFG